MDEPFGFKEPVEVIDIRELRRDPSAYVTRLARKGASGVVQELLNGTAITARAMIAILENFQEADGSIGVPNVLWQFGAPRRMGSVC